MTFAIEGTELARVSGRWEIVGAVLIGVGVVGLLFGIFWIVFAGICFIGGIGTLGNLVLLLVAGGLGPVIGATVLVALGAQRRLDASRLREVGTLAHGSGRVTVAQVATLMGGRADRAHDVLQRACELGLATPVAG